MIQKDRKEKGFKCLKCLQNVYVDYYTQLYANKYTMSRDSDIRKSQDKCTCGNLALLLDIDGFLHVYCDDITTIVLCEFDLSQGEIQRTQILGTSNSFVFQDYYSLQQQPWSFEPYEYTKIPKTKVTKVTNAFRRLKKHKQDRRYKGRNYG